MDNMEMERAQLRTAIILLLCNSNNGKGMPLEDAIISLESVLNDLKFTLKFQNNISDSR